MPDRREDLLGKGPPDCNPVDFTERRILMHIDGELEMSSKQRRVRAKGVGGRTSCLRVRHAPMRIIVNGAEKQKELSRTKDEVLQ